VGGGIYIDGRLLHGMVHPEAGHVLIRKRSDDTYEGKCPYHKTCLEGMAAGPAIEERWGSKAAELADRTEVWDLEADYIAQALTGYILTLSPEMIILGGGVMHQEQLFPLIRQKVTQLLGGYVQAEELEDMERYIVPASLHDDQGIMGCLELARREIAG
jgi:fructokinase